MSRHEQSIAPRSATLAWTCSSCTVQNRMRSRICEVCDTERPVIEVVVEDEVEVPTKSTQRQWRRKKVAQSAIASPVEQEVNASVVIDRQFWVCIYCTSKNQIDALKCEMCGSLSPSENEKEKRLRRARAQMRLKAAPTTRAPFAVPFEKMMIELEENSFFNVYSSTQPRAVIQAAESQQGKDEGFE